MRTSTAFIGLILAWLLSAGSAAPQSVGGPALGFVLDRTLGALRPIRGIPGAATPGDPVMLDLPLAEAWISPAQDYALAVTSKNGDVILIDLGGDPATAVPLEAVFVRPHRVAISPGGEVAALIDADRRRVQILSGLPRAPSKAGEYEIGPADSDVEALAVSDDGTALLIATRNAVYVALKQNFTTRGSVYVSRKLRFKRLLEALRPSAMTFMRNKLDALISDTDANSIVLVRDIAGAAETFTLATSRDGIAGPVAVQPSADGRRVYVANAVAASVSVLDLETGNVAHLACSVAPAGLFPLGSGSVFRLNELSDTPLMVLDGGRDEPRVVFVPRPVN